MRRHWPITCAGLLAVCTVLLLGQPVANPLLPRPVSAQTIQVTPASVDVGTVGLNITSSTRAFFTIRNLDTVDALEVSSVTSNNSEFVVLQPTGPVTIPVGSAFLIAVEFTPTTAGPRSGDFTVVSNDTVNSPTVVTVTGYGGLEQSIALSPQDIAVTLGQGLAFRAEVTFDNAATGLAQLNWSSSDPAVATVTEGTPDISFNVPTGDAAALALGTTLITVTGVHNPAAAASTSLTVVPVPTYRLIVTAAEDLLVEVNSGTASVLYDFPEVDPGGDPLHLVNHVGRDSSGNTYVAAENVNNGVDEVFYFNTSLVRTLVFSDPPSNLIAADIVVDSAGKAILTEIASKELLRVSLTDPLQGTLLSNTNLPSGALAIDASDNLYIGSALRVKVMGTVLDERAAVYRRTSGGTVTPLAALFNTVSPNAFSLPGVALTPDNKLYVLKVPSPGRVELETFVDLNMDGDYFQIVSNVIQADPGEILAAGSAEAGVDLDLDCRGDLLVSIAEPGGRRIERWHDFNGNGALDDPLERLVIYRGVTPFSIQDIAPDCGGPDTDSDGFTDVTDNCPAVANAGQADADSDLLGDVCDNCPITSNPYQEDGDSDTAGDACDNCLSAPNPLQEDIDSDSTGDACDPGDFDLDGYSDRVEFSAGTDRGAICPSGPSHNANPGDTNNDGFSDITDIIAVAGSFGQSVPPAQARLNVAPDPVDTFVDISDIVRMAADFGGICADADSDVIHDGIDNCLSVFNPAQGDVDSDDTGDACDPGDFDLDSYSDRVEFSAGTDPGAKCPTSPTHDANPADLNNDGFFDIEDIVILAGSFGQSVPPAQARLDIAPDPVDGFVDITDIVSAAGFFGQACVV